MSDDLAEFWRARLDEDEAAARQAEESGEETGEAFWPSVFGAYNEGYLTRGQAEHVGRHAPARVAGEVAASRAILAEHQPEPGEPRLSDWCKTCDAEFGYYPCRTVRHLAAIYSDHPDYRAEWKP